MRKTIEERVVEAVSELVTGKCRMMCGEMCEHYYGSPEFKCAKEEGCRNKKWIELLRELMERERENKGDNG